MAFSGVMSSTLTESPRYRPKKPSLRNVLQKQSNLCYKRRQNRSFQGVASAGLLLYSQLYGIYTVGSVAHMLVYWCDCWFWRRVLQRSTGKMTVTPTMPAMPPFTTFGRRLRAHKFTNMLYCTVHREIKLNIARTLICGTVNIKKGVKDCLFSRSIQIILFLSRQSAISREKGTRT